MALSIRTSTYKEEKDMTNEEAKAALAKLIGCEYTEAIKAEITRLTGRVLVVGPNEPHTKEINNSSRISCPLHYTPLRKRLA